MSKLSKVEKNRSGRITDKTSAPFELCFRDPLQNGYTFEDMDMKQVKQFQRFLDKAARMSYAEVDRLFRRPSDHSDIYDGEQIIHYAVTDKLRLHGIIETGHFIVLRLDPNHRFHK